MNPGDALGVAAQIAATLAGFAGVVVVFNTDAAHEWSQAYRFRLQLMLLHSAMPLAFCLAGMLLLTTKLLEQTVWAMCSGLAFVVAMHSVFRSAALFSIFAVANLDRPVQAG